MATVAKPVKPQDSHTAPASKEVYYERYQELKRRGSSFFPYDVYRDIVMWLVALAVLVILSVFFSAPLEDVANPQDNSYVPRPEWYFLFLFQALKYFPGPLEPIGTVLFPLLLVGWLVALPWIDRSKWRSPSRRPVIMIIGTAIFLLLVALTIISKLQDQAAAVSAF